MIRVFGKELRKDGMETLVRRLEVLAARHGEEVLIAARKVGPIALRLTEEAGPHAAPVVKLLARHGDEAVWVVSQPRRLAIFAKHGDQAAEVLSAPSGRGRVTHRGV